MTLTGNGIANCSFETATIAGWTLKDMIAPYCAAGATISPGGDCFGFPAYDPGPSYGTAYFATGWDGEGPDTIELSQDLTIQGSGILRFDHKAAWDLVPFGATLSRYFVVDVEPLGGGAPVQNFIVRTAAAGTSNQDAFFTESVLDLSSYVGQAQRVKFRWVVPENSTGPASFVLDNVELPGAPAAFCPDSPGTCNQSLTGLLSIKDNDDPAKRKLMWKWLNGTTTNLFGDPVDGATDYRLCVYDGSSVLVSDSLLQPGGTCDGKPCWKALGDKGFKFKSKTPNAAGLTQAMFKAGEGKAKIQVKAGGGSFDWLLPITDQVTVQIRVPQSAGGSCWGQTFTVPLKNETDQYKAKLVPGP